jgi:putative Mg2+ transporter-C (MgtC) family protein
MTSTSYLELILRMLATLIASAIVGIERESHGRAAGMRTTILVGVAACIAMMISNELFVAVANEGVPTRPDPARLAQGVLSGMGFLGAGAIIRNGNRVQGVTTAATLWYVSMLGLSFGGGLYFVGALGVVFSIIILFVLPRVESRVKNDWYAVVVIVAQKDAIPDEEIRTQLESVGVRVKKVDLKYDMRKQEKTLRFELKFKKEKVGSISESVPL